MNSGKEENRISAAKALGEIALHLIFPTNSHLWMQITRKLVWSVSDTKSCWYAIPICLQKYEAALLATSYQKDIPTDVPISRWKQVVITLLITLGLALLLGSLAVLGALFGVSQDILKDLFEIMMTNWAAGRQGWIIAGMVAVLAILVGILTALADILRKRLFPRV